MRIDRTVKVRNRNCVRVAFIVCLAAVWGYVSPSASHGVPLPQTASRPREPVATVGLGERIDPANAPHPSNESERLLFRQLYETLVRVDCNGRVGPGLASSWRLGAERNTWILTLRENA